MGKLFLSYRRADTMVPAGWLYDRLTRVFGREAVFKDVDDIPPGVDFRAYIAAKLAECSVVVALIGPEWLDARSADGRRRLDDPQDFVRQELEVAHHLGLPIVLLLVHGAQPPPADQLPPSLLMLAQAPSLPVRTGVRADPEMHLVYATLGQWVPPLVAVSGMRGRWTPVVWGGICGLVGALVYGSAASAPLWQLRGVSPTAAGIVWTLVIAGLLLPSLVAGFAVGRRTDRFSAGLAAGTVAGLLAGALGWIWHAAVDALVLGPTSPQSHADIQTSLAALSISIVGGLLLGTGLAALGAQVAQLGQRSLRALLPRQQDMGATGPGAGRGRTRVPARIGLLARPGDAPVSAAWIEARLRLVFGYETILPVGPQTSMEGTTCRVLALVVGPHWLSTRDHRRPLDDPLDPVRRQVEQALAAGVPLLPILVEGAAHMPAGELPASLQPLAYVNTIRLRDRADAEPDLVRICHGLTRWVKPQVPLPPQHPVARAIAIGVSGGVILSLACSGGWLLAQLGAMLARVDLTRPDLGQGQLSIAILLALVGPLLTGVRAGSRTGNVGLAALAGMLSEVLLVLLGGLLVFAGELLLDPGFVCHLPDFRTSSACSQGLVATNAEFVFLLVIWALGGATAGLGLGALGGRGTRRRYQARLAGAGLPLLARGLDPNHGRSSATPWVVQRRAHARKGALLVVPYRAEHNTDATARVYERLVESFGHRVRRAASLAERTAALSNTAALVLLVAEGAQPSPAQGTSPGARSTAVGEAADAAARADLTVVQALHMGVPVIILRLLATAGVAGAVSPSQTSAGAALVSPNVRAWSGGQSGLRAPSLVIRADPDFTRDMQQVTDVLSVWVKPIVRWSTAGLARYGLTWGVAAGLAVSVPMAGISLLFGPSLNDPRVAGVTTANLPFVLVPLVLVVAFLVALAASRATGQALTGVFAGLAAVPLGALAGTVALAATGIAVSAWIAVALASVLIGVPAGVGLGALAGLAGANWFRGNEARRVGAL